MIKLQKENTIIALIMFLSIGVNQWMTYKQKQMPQTHQTLDLTTTEEFAGVEYCSLHQTKLQKDMVPVTGGLASVARVINHRKLFPYANKSYDPGCVAGNYQQAKIKYCGDCRRAETWWAIKNVLVLF